MTYFEIADKLNELQKTKNDGRGISCVKTICHYLKLGQIESAKQVARTDGDKLCQYSDIRIFIHTNLTPIGYWSDSKNEVIK